MSACHFIMIAFAKHSPLTCVAFHPAGGKGIASLLNRHAPSPALRFSNQARAERAFDLLNAELTKSASARIPPMPKLSAAARARKIKLLLFDVDGVLTDGKLFVFPAPAGAQQTVLEQSAQHGGQGGFGLDSQTLIEAKGFHAHDGTSISLARLAGIKTGLITKRISETVALRARDLKLEHIHQGVQDKRTCLEDILRGEGLKSEEAAFVGDDVIDLPAMRGCGLAIAVKNARAEVKREAHYVTPHAGGDGALRDAVEYILKAQGKWKRVLDEYIGERSPRGRP
jgi:3-deoxy-D-manno-octulosonate 8-phosphate phosphatase (KDO 8-P phosphatase)